MTEVLTDRDRLAMAFNDLRERGYYADITMSYRICCRDCALREMALNLRDSDEDPDDEIAVLPDRFVFWYVQKDDWSFVGSGDGFPVPERYVHMDDEALAVLQDEIDAAITADRMSKYADLVKPLNLHWHGNADEIVDVLRNNGLTCAVPNSDQWCIEIAPSRTFIPTGV